MGYPVNSPSEQQGTLTSNQIAGLTTTLQTILYPSGALTVSLSYRNLPGSTATAGQYAKVVINASSDSDANGKFATSGYITLCQGDDRVISGSSVAPITRIDLIAEKAVGSEVTLIDIEAVVQS